MTEETKDAQTNIQEPVEELDPSAIEEIPEETPQQPQYTEIEKIAMRMGWNPEHKNGDNDRKYVSAEDFILRGREIQETMTKQMKEQNKKLNMLEYGLSELKQHNENVYKANVAKLKSEITQLKSQRKKAIEDGDHATVNSIDEQIDRITKIPDTPPKSPAPQENPVFDSWLEKNEWYDLDEELRNYACAQGELEEFTGMRNNNKSYQKMLDIITGRVKKMFPEKFPQEKSKNPPAEPSVEPAQPRKKQKTTKHTYADLTDNQKKMCDSFVRMGVMTREDYIKDLETLGALS